MTRDIAVSVDNKSNSPDNHRCVVHVCQWELHKINYVSK